MGILDVIATGLGGIIGVFILLVVWLLDILLYGLGLALVAFIALKTLEFLGLSIPFLMLGVVA